jgi:hypothetical protein
MSMLKRPHRPRDPFQLAHQVIQEAIGERPPQLDPDAGKNPAAVALGKLGGAKGGRARAAGMTADQRREAAKRAAQARWGTRQKSR